MMKAVKKFLPTHKLEIFGYGPWVDEYDYVEFIHAGILCIVQRNPSLGTLSGLCILPDNHSWNEDGTDLSLIQSHGLLVTILSGGKVRLGFICSQEGDLIPSDDLIEDTTKTYRTLDYVIDQCKYLAEQILEAHEPYPM